jgi:(p)ppGpp synthase/HD superfamily hydrolase
MLTLWITCCPALPDYLDKCILGILYNVVEDTNFAIHERIKIMAKKEVSKILEGLHELQLPCFMASIEDFRS